MQRRLGKEPLLDLTCGWAKARARALAMHLVEAARCILTEIATFDEAHVSKAKP